MFQISVESSDYSDVNLINTINQGKINIKDPSYFYGFYHNDVVQFDGKDKPLKLLNRAKNDNIAGILELFGTYSFKPNKRGVPGYLFRPLDRSYPIFIVRSKLKRKSTENGEYDLGPQKSRILTKLGVRLDLNEAQPADVKMNKLKEQMNQVQT